MTCPANDNDSITFFSVCSGIEAASVAWTPLGWRCVGVSEIEKFPSAVLAHHYPDVKNHGDFTAVDVTTLPRVDILCGGTPCQAFSVAGLRRSLDDARGNLSLSFVRLAHELADNNGLRNVVWENVPGVLSTKDNAFGCFLGALVGADDAVPPPAGRRWPDEGMVSGPKGRAAWAILDAQYFGLAQRRKRVILVADFGTGADPAAVLLEFHGLSRNPPARGEAGKDIATAFSASAKGGGGLGTDFDLDGGLIEAERIAPTVGTGTRGVGDFELGGGLAYAPEIARCDATREGSSQDYETTTMVAVASIHADAIGRTGEAITPGADAAGVVRLRNPGMGVIDDGTTYNLMASGHPHAICVTGDITHTLKAEGADASEDGTGLSIIAFDTTQITSAANRSNPQPGDPCHPLSAQAHPPAIAFNAEAQADQLPSADRDTSVNDGLTVSQRPPVATTSAVRRLTPTECERLMGFPDGYTNIPWRGKPTSPDGPRYKALGNSWAVPKFTWLGRRIAMHMPARTATLPATRSEAA